MVRNQQPTNQMLVTMTVSDLRTIIAEEVQRALSSLQHAELPHREVNGRHEIARALGCPIKEVAILVQTACLGKVLWKKDGGKSSHLTLNDAELGRRRYVWFNQQPEQMRIAMNAASIPTEQRQAHISATERIYKQAGL